MTRTMRELAYVNGVFQAISQATVSIEDRGFQFGDGVYEVVTCFDGRPFLLEQHLERLVKSLAAIQIDFDVQILPDIIREGVRRSTLPDAPDSMVYIQITRGVASRIHAIPSEMTPTVIITFKPPPPFTDSMRLRGIRVQTIEDPRWTKCFVKAITLLPNILAKTEARRQGYDDAVFTAADGTVRESTSSNIFIVNDGCLITPPLDDHVLHGITRWFLLRRAPELGISVQERAFDVATMFAADEAFLSSTTAEALGIVRVNAQTIGQGTVGPVTRRLYDDLVEWRRADIQRHFVECSGNQAP